MTKEVITLLHLLRLHSIFGRRANGVSPCPLLPLPSTWASRVEWGGGRDESENLTLMVVLQATTSTIISQSRNPDHSPWLWSPHEESSRRAEGGAMTDF